MATATAAGHNCTPSAALPLAGAPHAQTSNQRQAAPRGNSSAATASAAGSALHSTPIRRSCAA